MKRLMTVMSGSLFILAACASLAQTPATSGGTAAAAGSTASVLCDYSESTFSVPIRIQSASAGRGPCSAAGMLHVSDPGK
ncbi:hypothetical protein DESA109040_11755 [Deinococcus saxicola]|uniref:hypothetical protein n=1 Tax=Deinococcus saxicola TaxID=249406 RepID=UPI0039EF6256